MKKTGLACALAAGLIGCWEQQSSIQQEQYKLEQQYKEWFLTAMKSDINWVPTVVWIFKAWTTDSAACIKDITTQSVRDLLDENNHKKEVDVCFFPNAKLMSDNNLVPAS